MLSKQSMGSKSHSKRKAHVHEDQNKSTLNLEVGHIHEDAETIRITAGWRNGVDEALCQRTNDPFRTLRDSNA